MKLLFDQNLSHKLVRRLADLFPKSVHLREVGLKEAGDPLVWEYAKNNGLGRLEGFRLPSTKFPLGYPPKVVWVRLGQLFNSRRLASVAGEFRDHQSFYEDISAAFLSLS